MGKPSIEEVVKTSEVVIHSGRYAYLKTTDKKLGNHFLVSQDEDEITIITEEKHLKEVSRYSDLVGYFKLIEIKVSVPFLQGFLSYTIKPIAEAGCNTLIVSTFSKDYILTREEVIDKVAEILKKTGFKVTFKK
ncbi:MAG: ACT domain-containing protein [bacterium]|nr:ACT domain-containing protein [bacterium]